MYKLYFVPSITYDGIIVRGDYINKYIYGKKEVTNINVTQLVVF